MAPSASRSVQAKVRFSSRPFQVLASRLRGRSRLKLHRIGAIFVGNADSDAFRAELQQEIRKYRYIEGQNVVFVFRSAEEKLDRLPQLAAELIALKVDVIVAVYTPCALAAQRATRDILWDPNRNFWCGRLFQSARVSRTIGNAMVEGLPWRPRK
jgi:hypothetical protein